MTQINHEQHEHFLRYAFFVVAFFFAFAGIAEAEVQSIVSAESGGFIQSIGNIYKFAQGLGVGLAILMITVGGIYIALSGASPSKQAEGKDMILSAIWGLVLLFGAVLILNTINPKLTILSISKPHGAEMKLPTRPCGPDEKPGYPPKCYEAAQSCPANVMKNCDPSIRTLEEKDITRLQDQGYIPNCIIVWGVTLQSCAEVIVTKPGIPNDLKVGARYKLLPFYPKVGRYPKSPFEGARCLLVAYEKKEDEDGVVKIKDAGGRDGLRRCPPQSLAAANSAAAGATMTGPNGAQPANQGAGVPAAGGGGQDTTPQGGCGKDLACVFSVGQICSKGAGNCGYSKNEVAATRFITPAGGGAVLTGGYMEPKGHGGKNPHNYIAPNGELKTISTPNHNIGIDYQLGGSPPYVGSWYYGRVIKAREEGGYGNRVHLKTSYCYTFAATGKKYPIKTAYAHLKSIDESIKAPGVWNLWKGSPVDAGDVVGIMGGTGGNYSPHVDMQIYIDVGGDYGRVSLPANLVGAPC
ncbi:MAG: peptidoglycan DD-metalloendopeptidase family protein [Patescibacteria group bacterium]